MARKVRPLTLTLVGATLIVAANWILAPRLYPNYRDAVPLVTVTILVGYLLVFGTVDSLRRRLRERRRKRLAS